MPRIFPTVSQLKRRKTVRERLVAGEALPLKDHLATRMPHEHWILHKAAEALELPHGAPVSAKVLGEAIGKVKDQLKSQIEAGQPAEVEAHLFTSDDRPFWVWRATCAAHRWASGKLVTKQEWDEAQKFVLGIRLGY